MKSRHINIISVKNINNAIFACTSTSVSCRTVLARLLSNVDND